MVQAIGPPVDDNLHINGSSRPRKVAYFYDADIGNFSYSSGHPMKPHRIRIAHSLILNSGLYKKMEIYRAKPASKLEMTQFHTDEYIDFLHKVTPDNIDNFAKEQGKHNVGDDCPAFDGLFDFCGISAGGSMEGAARLNRGKCDIAINWAGGLHHAKKNEASGFCYVNDIVLAILELLRHHKRVLYIDIDVHHGDGVEEAFYTTDRVMTVSFHKYGEYFPGTGEVRDIGVGEGKNYSVNFPLRDGIDDTSYKNIFEPIINAVMEWYTPEAIVLQCGGDSLSGDHLGCFNLSMKGHANCISLIKSFDVPTLILGGGGYTMRNVSRAWAYETGLLVGQKLGPQLPFTEYYEYFAPDFELDVKASKMENLNFPEYLNKIKTQLMENLSRTHFNPSVQMQDIPLGLDELDDEVEAEMDDMDEDENKDARYTQRRWDMFVEKDGELSESDDEQGNPEHNTRPRQPTRRGIMDYRNPDAIPDFDETAVASEGSRNANNDNSSSAEENRRRSASTKMRNGVKDLNGQAGEMKRPAEENEDTDMREEAENGEMDTTTTNGDHAAAQTLTLETSEAISQRQLTVTEERNIDASAPIVMAAVDIDMNDDVPTNPETESLKEQAKEDKEEADTVGEARAEFAAQTD